MHKLCKYDLQILDGSTIPKLSAHVLCPHHSVVGGRTKAFTSAEWLPKANLARNAAIVDAIGIARNIFRGSATSCWLSMCMKGVGSQQELSSSVVVVAVVVVGGNRF